MTSPQSDHPDDLDTIVGEIARQMTAARPASNLRARVVSRLDDRTPRGGWRWLPLVVLTASALLIAVWWTRAPRGAASQPVQMARLTPPVPHDVAQSAQANHDASPNRPARSTANGASARPRPAAPAAPVMSEAEAAWHARAVPALTAPAALDIVPLDQAGVAIAPVDIQPLVTEPLTVKSIGAGLEVLK